MTRRDPHIGYLVQQFPPEVGAGPARVTEMAAQWRESGARVTVITGIPNRSLPGRAFGEGDPQYAGRYFVQEDWKGLRVLRSWQYRSTNQSFARTLLNNVSFMISSAMHGLARVGDVDVLIASSPPLFPHAAGAVVAAMRGVPLVLEIRDLWPDYLVGMGRLKAGAPLTRALFAFERMLLRRASYVVAVTESFRKRIVEKGVPPDRIVVIPNGVDLTYYFAEASVPPLPALVRAPGEFLVGYLGSFGAGQALEIVLEAAALLSVDDPTIRVILAGDGPERERVVARAAEMSLSNLSISGTIPKTDTRAFYNSCDLCLVPLAPIPIFQETIPSKIFEVMACERPVLACLDGEGRQIIERSGGGAVAPPGNPRAIADAILRLRRTPRVALEEMGRSGRAYVNREYDRSVLAARYYELLQQASRATKT